MDEFNELKPQGSTKRAEIGKVDLGEEPQILNVEALSMLLPGSKHLPTAEGNEYILDGEGRTILLFGDKKETGFGSVYSPRTKKELLVIIGQIPEGERTRICSLLGIEEDEVNETQSENPTTSIKLPDIMTSKYPDLIRRKRQENSLLGFGQHPIQPRLDLPTSQDKQPEIQHISPTEIPKDHFLELSEEDLQAMKAQQWNQVKDLDENDPRKIVYYRRFTREFRSRMPFNPELTSQSTVQS